MKVTLIMAQTIDGKVARSTEEFIDWTPKEDKKFFVQETKRIGTVIMGRRTFESIGKPLKDRTIIVMSRSPHESMQLETGIVHFTSETPETLLARLEAEGKTEVALGGGPTINRLFLDKNLIAEIKLTITPLIFGSGLSMFDGPAVTVPVELIASSLLTPQTVLLHYKVVIDNKVKG